MTESNGRSRRVSPRVEANSLCSELNGDRVRHALVVDVSEHGIRLQRPLGGPRRRDIQLEIELPGVDEIVWARGEICFDEVWNVRGGDRALGGILRTSGVRILSTAARHRRLVREYVFDRWAAARRRHDLGADLLGAACYLRG